MVRDPEPKILRITTLNELADFNAGELLDPETHVHLDVDVNNSRNAASEVELRVAGNGRTCQAFVADGSLARRLVVSGLKVTGNFTALTAHFWEQGLWIEGCQIGEYLDLAQAHLERIVLRDTTVGVSLLLNGTQIDSVPHFVPNATPPRIRGDEKTCLFRGYQHASFMETLKKFAFSNLNKNEIHHLIQCHLTGHFDGRRAYSRDNPACDEGCDLLGTITRRRDTDDRTAGRPQAPVRWNATPADILRLDQLYLLFRPGMTVSNNWWAWEAQKAFDAVLNDLT